VIAYVDSSVVVRYLLLQPNRLADLTSCEQLVTSQLTQLECLRTLDKARIEERLVPDEIIARSAALFSQLRRMRRVAVSRSILDRGGSSLPLPVKALDAIHLATALQFREREEPDLLFATHDRQQGRAALALGFQVIGL
jgi:predicted nucleic acid-binding protein